MKDKKPIHSSTVRENGFVIKIFRHPNGVKGMDIPTGMVDGITQFYTPNYTAKVPDVGYWQGRTVYDRTEDEIRNRILNIIKNNLRE